MTNPDLPYWIAFAHVPRIGAKRMALLEAAFPSMADAWRAAPGELRAAGLDGATLRSLAQRRPAIEPERELQRLKEAGIHPLTWHDDDYPPRLREIADRPPLLFLRGALQPRDELSVAVVGTRRPSPYGRQVTEEFSRGLAQNGVTVVSGLARGVDGIAQRAALDAGGRTVGVLACGLDIVYPPEHDSLVKRIVEQERGAILSEHPLGTQPRADYFPRRNRILSGVSLGTLVTEAAAGSGSLHTANWANEQNREVFAVPGRITSPTSRATNALIQQGMAKLVADVGDVLEELNLQMVERQAAFDLAIPEDPTQAAVLRRLGREPVHVDEAVRAAGLPASTVASALAMLELKGMVRQVGPMLYVRT